MTSVSNIDGTTVTNINQTGFIYFEEGVGEIANTQDGCVPEGSFLANNTPGCTVNQYFYDFFNE